MQHDLLSVRNQTWQDGIKHGKWLAQQEVENYDRDIQLLADTRAELFTLQVAHGILKKTYDELVAQTNKDLTV